jgi:hypothetical protein
MPFSIILLACSTVVVQHMSEVAEAKHSEIQRFIKGVTETLTILGIGSYSFGFLIVNSYLLSFGYAPYSLFKTTYLSAGVLFVLFTTPIVLAVYSLRLGFRLTAKGDPQRTRLNIGTFGILLFFFTVLFYNIGINDMWNDPDEWTPYSWRLFLGILGFVGGTILVYLENTGKQWKFAEWAKRYRGLWLLTMYLTSVVATLRVDIVIYLSSLTAVLYGLVGVLFQDKSFAERLKD